MAKVRKRGKTYQIDYFDPTGKRVRKSFKKKKEAEEELGKRVSLIGENRYLDVKKDYTTTLKELLDKYKENYQDQASFMSLKQYCLENFKEHWGEDERLSSIRYVHIEEYRNHLKKKLTINGTIRTSGAINREMSCLHHIFKKAVEWDMIEESPFNKGSSLILEENNERLRYLEEDEIIRLLEECASHIRPVVECAINTGMRRQEILNLKHAQIKYIHNLKTGEKDGFIYLKGDETKNRKARQVPVNDDLEVVLKEIRHKQGLGAKYVFTYQKSEDKLKGVEPVRKRKRLAPIPERVKSVKTAFNSALRRAGIVDFKFHDLRHTFSSHFIMRGGSLKELQEILGHKKIEMTMRYAHLSQEHKMKAVNLLNGLTSSIKPDMSQNVTFPKSTVSTIGQVLDITGRDDRI